MADLRRFSATRSVRSRMSSSEKRTSGSPRGSASFRTKRPRAKPSGRSQGSRTKPSSTSCSSWASGPRWWLRWPWYPWSRWRGRTAPSTSGSGGKSSRAPRSPTSPWSRPRPLQSWARGGTNRNAFGMDPMVEGPAAMTQRGPGPCARLIERARASRAARGDLLGEGKVSRRRPTDQQLESAFAGSNISWSARTWHIGGGAAGINALKAAASLNARVALVDRGPLGGTCVNWG